jgi:hypothetical protein
MKGINAMKIVSSFWHKRSVLSWILSALASYLTLLFVLSFLPSAGKSHLFLWLPLFLALMAASRSFFIESNQRLARYAWWIGFLMLLSSFFGFQLNLASGFGGWSGAFRVLGASLCASPAAAFLVCTAYRICENAADMRTSCNAIKKPKKEPSEKSLFWGYAGILFLCWLPVFLAYYPSVFSYDVFDQIPQVVQGAYRTANPLLHTFFLGGFYLLGGLLGSYNTGIALYTIVQMIMIALILAYALLYLFRLGCSRTIRIAALLFFALFPICPMLAISATKDSLFAPVLLLSALYLHQWYANPALSKDVPFLLRLVFSLALLCLLRNNAILTVGICLILGLFLLRREKFHLRFSALLLAGLALFAFPIPLS